MQLLLNLKLISVTNQSVLYVQIVQLWTPELTSSVGSVMIEEALNMGVRKWHVARKYVFPYPSHIFFSLQFRLSL